MRLTSKQVVQVYAITMIVTGIVAAITVWITREAVGLLSFSPLIIVFWYIHEEVNVVDEVKIVYCHEKCQACRHFEDD